MPSPIELTVVVVTWNCRELALRCLANAAQCMSGIPHEIIVVDNGSTDGTPDAVAVADPSLVVLRNKANLGFARANNVALSRARGRFWLLLNPDAFPSVETIRMLIAALRDDPAAAAAGPKLLMEDGRHQVGDAGYAPSPASVAIHSLFLTRIAPQLRGLFVTRTLPIATMQVDWLCGACLLVRASAAGQVGLLDETFFLYGEDIEWGCRLREAGWRVLYLPAASAVHLVGGTQDARTRVSARWLDGVATVFIRRHGLRAVPLFRAAIVVGYGARAIIYGLISILPGRRPRYLVRARSMLAYAHHAMRMRSGPTFTNGEVSVTKTLA